MEFIDLLNAARSSGKSYAFAVITAAQGATPRHPGAKMVIYEDGTLAGTIGGGEIEQNVIAARLPADLRSRHNLLHDQLGS